MRIITELRCWSSL